VAVFRRMPGVAGEPGLPTQLGQLSNLEGLNIAEMQLQGSLPTQLGELTMLTFLYASNSNLTGYIPTEAGSSPLLQYLHLQGNSISGTIPVELGNASNLGHVDLEANPISGSLPDFFGQFAHLEYWNTFDCRLHTSHVPPSIKILASRLFEFEFYVQDEQLEYLADFRCARNRFEWQRIGERALGYKVNYVLQLARDYNYYRERFCTERYQPGGLAAQFLKNFGPGDRYPTGLLKPDQIIYHGIDSEVYAKSGVVSGVKFRKEDAWMLPGDPGSYSWLPDENGDDSPPPRVGLPILQPPFGNRRTIFADNTYDDWVLR